MNFKNWINDNQILFYKRDSEKYGFLSNFHYSTFELDGQIWPTVEHYYMAMKSNDQEYQQKIINAATPGKAKRLGDSRLDDPKQAKQSLFRRGHQLRKDWDDYKLEVMKKAIYAKFIQNPHLKKALKDTGNKELIEDSASDSFWGSGNGSGHNWLGKILMNVRENI